MSSADFAAAIGVRDERLAQRLRLPRNVTTRPNMLTTDPKPRMLLFQYKYDVRLPPFLLLHMREHVKCLAEFFDVTVIREDCDFVQVCDRHEPDVVLVEAGVNHTSCKRLRIENVRRNPSVPRLGLHHADAFCNARAGFISDMDHWDISTFFAISTTAAEHTPDIAKNLFYWPVFIDSDVFRDYGLQKTIPVLITGNSNQLYPWRQKVFPLLASRYPSLRCPHPGYEPANSFAQVRVGADYARTLNAAWCVPACGTVAGETVRKHFEVPGSMACLVTQKSAALEAAGFADMVNCVFTEGNDAVEKLDWLFRNPGSLAEIIDAGHELVHSRHTHKHRGQIYEWFRLNGALPGTHRIIQSNPFELPLSVPKEASACSSHIHSNGQHLQLIREGDGRLAKRDFVGAERAYLECMSLMPWMPEPRVRTALCHLYRGEAMAAVVWLDQPTSFVLNEYGATDPDPVEWALRVVSLVCMGLLRYAAAEARKYPGLAHPELARARWLCRFLLGDSSAHLSPIEARPPRASIHVLEEKTHAEWVADTCLMLRACGQEASALRLAADTCPTGIANSRLPRIHRDAHRLLQEALSTLIARPQLALRCSRLAATWSRARPAIRKRAAHFAHWLRSPIESLAEGANAYDMSKNFPIEVQGHFRVSDCSRTPGASTATTAWSKGMPVPAFDGDSTDGNSLSSRSKGSTRTQRTHDREKSVVETNSSCDADAATRHR